jgi:hypothetical protein
MAGKRLFHILIIAFITASALSAIMRATCAAPLVDFEPGTDGYTDYVFVNASASDPSNNVSVFIDFDDSLVSWWRMDDLNATGDIVDYTGRNNGSVEGGATQEDAGYFGKGFTFENPGDCINVSNYDSFDFGPNQSFSFSLWINVDYDAIQTLISSYGEYFLAFYGSGSDFRWRTGVDVIFNNNPFGTGWHHIVVGRNQTHYYGFYDGVLDKATANTTMGNQSANTEFNIGCQGGLIRNFNGTIDDVMIFNRSLSTAEIGALYANQTSKYLERNFTNLTDWRYSFRAYAQNGLGNVNSTQKSVVLSANLPQVTIILPLATSYYSKTINLNWSVDRTIDWAGYSLNGAGNVTLTPQTEQDAEDSYSCSGSFLEDCSNATDEDWNTYAECTSGSSCVIFENVTIPGQLIWANWSYKIYKVDGISSYSTQYWNYSAGGWSTLDTTGTAEGYYWRNVTIPADGLSGPVLRIRNPIEGFLISKQRYYEGKVEWKYAYNRTISAKSGTNNLIVYANESSGGTGSSGVSFEYVTPPPSIQMMLRLDNLENQVYVPGTGTIASASITNTTYNNPSRWYLASYLNDVLNALVFSYQTPAMLEVNRSSSSHELVLSQNLENSKSFLVFTAGDWQTIDNRIGLIEEREFMNEISPSFSHGLGISYLVKILLSYPDIRFGDNMTFGKGYHGVVFNNMGTQDRNVLLDASSA